MTNNKSKIKYAKCAYTLVGILITIWELRIGMLSLFTFREHEAALSWWIVFSGPLFTLPMFLVGLRSPRISSWCFFFGATLALLLMVISEGVQGEHILRFALMVSMPMYLLAILGLIRDFFGKE